MFYSESERSNEESLVTLVVEMAFGRRVAQSRCNGIHFVQNDTGRGVIAYGCMVIPNDCG